METFCHYITLCVALVLNVISHRLIRLITANCRFGFFVPRATVRGRAVISVSLSVCRVCHDAFCTLTWREEGGTSNICFGLENDLKLNIAVDVTLENFFFLRLPASQQCSFRTGNPECINVCIIVLVLAGPKLTVFPTIKVAVDKCKG